MNIWVPYSTLSMLGYRYFLTMMDDHNKLCWIYLMKLKSRTSNFVKSFVTFNKTVIVIKTNNGPEFHIRDFYIKHEIVHHIFFIGTPQQMKLLNVNTKTS